MYIYNDKTPPHIFIERLKTKVTFYTLQMVKKEIFMYLEIKQFIAKFNDPFNVTVQKQLMFKMPKMNLIFNFQTDLVFLQFFKLIISWDTFDI
jgi:hypothetical protein